MPSGGDIGMNTLKGKKSMLWTFMSNTRMYEMLRRKPDSALIWYKDLSGTRISVTRCPSRTAIERLFPASGKFGSTSTAGEPTVFPTGGQRTAGV